ncbi:hypothetical protein HDV57DRAFT_360951 [Trichoderma longibrachiatum]|uniref:Extracellular membrane protein CFEM domain-containing protein n=1 Tax=Trichoderma longibrachiatum ATCC 18648 TaxID=983965 RepID=A0A2T4BX25_TRILO|nr:hypothetical protein M440DRAFT_1424428 [Trichoderma longibrachiatum ATCC 18648]
MQLTSITVLALETCLLSRVHAQASPISCLPTVTITTRLGTSEGCRFNCSSDFCILDNVVTLPCGCSQAAGVITQTVTACATSSPCWNCHTGFPFTTTATDCP